MKKTGQSFFYCEIFYSDDNKVCACRWLGKLLSVLSWLNALEKKDAKHTPWENMHRQLTFTQKIAFAQQCNAQ